jgi:hypothetical protein
MLSHALSRLPFLGRLGRPADRRQSKRLVPRACTLCLIRLPGEVSPIHGFVQNLSTRGLGVRLSCRFEPGTQLSLLLINAAHTYALAVELEVVRCSEASAWGCYLGGVFVQPLCHEELEPLLR